MRDRSDDFNDLRGETEGAEKGRAAGTVGARTAKGILGRALGRGEAVSVHSVVVHTAGLRVTVPWLIVDRVSCSVGLLE